MAMKIHENLEILSGFGTMPLVSFGVECICPDLKWNIPTVGKRNYFTV